MTIKKQINRFFLILALGFVYLTHSGSAVAAEYSYYVDSFKVTGNIPGSQQDDFNDGDTSSFNADSGTVVKSGGYFNLKSPGDHSIRDGIATESSDIETSATSEFNIAVGSGNAVATSRWVNNLAPALNQSYTMGLEFLVDTGNPLSNYEIEFFVGLINADSHMVASYGLPEGLYAIFLVNRYTDIDETLVLQGVPVDDLSVFDSGSLFLNLLYNDSTEEVSANIVFGDDESATPDIMFDSIAMPEYTGDLRFNNWSMEGAAFSAVPIPAAIWLFGSGLAGLAAYRKRPKENKKNKHFPNRLN